MSEKRTINPKFPLDPRFEKEYWAAVDRGRRVAANSHVAICGLARNVAGMIHTTRWRIDRLRSLFQADCPVFIYENDSSDATELALCGWRYRDPQCYVRSERLGDPVNPGTRCLNRAERMARYRNSLRQFVLDSLAAHTSYIIVIDLDLAGGWSNLGILNTLGQTQPWDFVGSNSILFKDWLDEPRRPLYFDVWAFRWAGSDKPTLAREINPLHWPNGSPMVPVNSCFGGLGIYRTEAFSRCSYGGGDCEHVTFHRRLREAGMGRLFMNPSQITLYNADEEELE